MTIIQVDYGSPGSTESRTRSHLAAFAFGRREYQIFRDFSLVAVSSNGTKLVTKRNGTGREFASAGIGLRTSSGAPSTSCMAFVINHDAIFRVRLPTHFVLG